jgi:hypothetical protein
MKAGASARRTCCRHPRLAPGGLAKEQRASAAQVHLDGAAASLARGLLVPGVEALRLAQLGLDGCPARLQLGRAAREQERRRAALRATGAVAGGAAPLADDLQRGAAAQRRQLLF